MLSLKSVLEVEAFEFLKGFNLEVIGKRVVTKCHVLIQALSTKVLTAQGVVMLFVLVCLLQNC